MKKKKHNSYFESKNLTRSFVRRKQVSTSAEVRCCYISALVLTCFRLGSCYIFSVQNNCYEFLAFYDVIIQSVIQWFYFISITKEIFSKSWIFSAYAETQERTRQLTSIATKFVVRYWDLSRKFQVPKI